MNHSDSLQISVRILELIIQNYFSIFRLQKNMNVYVHAQYQFVSESHRTMSKAYFNCPFNQTDCFRPHYVPADGFDRGILTVNRMMPGPSIQVSNFAKFCLYYSSSFPLNVTHTAKCSKD